MNIFEWPKNSLAQHKIYTSAFESYFLPNQNEIKTLGLNMQTQAKGIIYA